ncbi:MAG: ATP-binding protein [Bacteroidales bacterium]
MTVFNYTLKSWPDFKFRFDEDKERIFLADYIGNSLVVIRAGYFLGILLFAVFGILDIWMVPETLNIAWFIRFTVVIPILLLTILVSFTDFFKRYNQIVLIATSALVGLGIVAMIACAKPTELGYKYYYSGLMLVIFLIYTFIRLRFWNSIIAALIITFGYELVAVFIQRLTDGGMDSENTMVFINNNFFFLSANIIGMWASYYIEKLQRSNFLQNRVILDENVRIKSISDMLMHKNEEVLAQSAQIESQSEELEYANTKLEEKVQERTEELQKSNNELVMARDKAQASDRLKTAFMHNISHEVRTPLNGILGFSSLIANPEIDANSKQTYLTLLKNSSERLVNTITDYIDISLIASENMEVSQKSVLLNEELSTFVSKYHTMCLQKAISFNCIINKDYDGFSFQTDPELFRKIMVHLLDNAVKFTTEGSVTLSYSITDNKLEIQVNDTGAGISEEAQERIFESFIQEEVADTRGHEGSGLGLSVVNGLLTLMGGSIRLESVKGEGSSFTVTIPLEGQKSKTTTEC